MYIPKKLYCLLAICHREGVILSYFLSKIQSNQNYTRITLAINNFQEYDILLFMIGSKNNEEIRLWCFSKTLLFSFKEVRALL